MYRQALMFTLPLILVLPLAMSGTAHSASPKTQSFGEGVKGQPTHSISEIQKNKESLEGEFVRVKGKVVDVCPMKGCWLELEDVKTGKRIKVKVKDDVIVFPQKAKGKMGTFQGKLVAKHMSKKKARQYMRHLAREKGEDFDELSVKGPMTIYEIAGTGAEIEGLKKVQ